MPSAPLRLRCELVINPLGVTNHPHLSWWISDARPAEIQSAYEIIAATTAVKLQNDEGDLWQSGRVESSETAHVIYQGLPLASGQRVWWKVRTFDSDGISSPWSELSHFEMGLLDDADWRARWIATPLFGSRSHGVHVAALRREISVAADLVRARIYIAALGDYRLSVNGQVVRETVCSAVWCNYEQQHYYQTLDLKEMLTQGDNVLGVLLADGYFAGHIPGAGRSVYGDRPKLRAMLVLEYKSGHQTVIGTDYMWRWRPSWILSAEINAGEHVDARQHDPSWDTTKYLDRGWFNVDVVEDIESRAKSQPYPAIGIHQALRATKSECNDDRDRHIASYDFGQQIVGRIRVDLNCAQSDEIVVRYSVDEKFSETTRDTFTSLGESGEVFETTFALHTYRYVQIETTGILTEILDVHALRVGHSDLLSMTLRSDHATLNRLFEALENNLKAVSFSVPMAGVAQAQRLPHIGIATTWVPFLAQQSGARGIVTKWLDDMKLSSHLADQTSAFSPAVLSPRVTQSEDDYTHFEYLANVLWACYRYQNDRNVLQECYAEIRVAALGYRHRYPKLLRESSSTALYGEGVTAGLVATCTLFGALRIAGRIAGVLGYLGDYERIEGLAEDVRQAFKRRYLSNDGHLQGDTQSVYVAALYHNLLDDHEKKIAQTRLIELVQNTNYHADVVPAVVHGLLPCITTAGRLDLAYMILLQTSQPSWMANILEGNSLLTREVGQFGVAEIGLLEWLQESLIGISLGDDYSVDKNGYRSVRIYPKPPLGAQFLAGAPIEFVEARIETLQGRFEIKWYINGETFELDLRIPPSCCADVIMPDGISQKVQSGAHHFVMDFSMGGDGIPTLLDMASDR